MGTTTSAPGLTLDTSGEPWMGRCEGLGTVAVSADGTVTVAATPPDDLMRHRALEFGWGEPLSLARRGFVMVHAAAAVAPGRSGCLLISGHHHEQARLMVGLATDGWALLADRVTPCLWDDATLMAHPRQAPILAAQRHADAAHLSLGAVRHGSNAVEIAVQRHQSPCPVQALLTVEHLRIGTPAFEVRAGRSRFEAAHSLWSLGILAGDSSTQRRMADTLTLASLPMAVLRMPAGVGVSDEAMRALTDWVATTDA